MIADLIETKAQLLARPFISSFSDEREKNFSFGVLARWG
jgi:hypothetical protein